MPVPLAPYPTPPAPYIPPSANGAQNQLVCSGCRNLLLYPVGATSVCCAVCNAVTAVATPGTEMAQLVCGGCQTLLMYMRGATSVQCSCCHTVNLALEANQVAHINCGNCRMLLMYQYGARSVKCAVCNFVTSVGGSYKVIRETYSRAWKDKTKLGALWTALAESWTAWRGKFLFINTSKTDRLGFSFFSKSFFIDGIWTHHVKDIG